MMVLVTGVKGQLGYDVIKTLKARGYNNLLGIDIEDLDITKKPLVSVFMNKYNPDIIIHCAAYTAVDKAEEHSINCMNVNVNGTRNLVEWAKENNTKFVYISTDYVFDGFKDGKYKVTDLPNPKSVYGKSKYLGELEVLKLNRHFIIRISWVFGKNGGNFVKTMLRLGKEKQFLNVVSDQIGSPTYTVDLSILIADMIQTEKYGIYHATNEGVCSWFDFAEEIFKIAKINIKVVSVKTEHFNTKASRPNNSSMDKMKLDENGFKRLPDWKNALKRYLKEIEAII